MNLLRLARAQWDRVTGGCLFAIGAIALVLGWVRVSEEALTARQIPYVMSGGLGGLFMLGLGAVLWLSADMRDEWRKLDALERTTPTAATPQLGADSFEQQDARVSGLDAASPLSNGGVPRRTSAIRPERA